MNPFFNLIIFLAVMVFGAGIEIILSKIYFRTHGKHQIVHFKFFRYLLLLSIPLIAVFVMSVVIGTSILKFFFVFAVFGTVLEYFIGYAYQAVVGQRLWTYNKFSINGHTSLLSIPLWGLCGVLLFFLSKTIS